MQPSLATQGLRALDQDGCAMLGSRPQLRRYGAEPFVACIQRMVRVRLSSHENRGL